MEIYNIGDFLPRELRRGKPMQQQEFIATKEVAHLTGFSVRTIVTWAGEFQDSGGTEGIPSYRIGKRAWSFKRSEVERWIESRRAGSVQPNRERKDKVG